MSALVGKVYSAAGQAAVCLHTMYLLQAYQAELLGDHNEGGGCGPNTVCELRRATDLSVKARDLHRYFEGQGLKWKKGHLYIYIYFFFLNKTLNIFGMCDVDKNISIFSAFLSITIDNILLIVLLCWYLKDYCGQLTPKVFDILHILWRLVHSSDRN